MATEAGSTRLAADLLLERDHGTDLAGFIAARRPDRSWRLIARDLWEATDGQVDVTSEALRKWFGPPAQRRPGSASTTSAGRRQAS